MDRPGIGATREVERVLAYDRRSVERFFAAACERRAYLLGEIAAARRRIAEAGAALESTRDAEARIVAMVLDAHRQLNEEARSNKTKIAKALVNGATEAERVAADAKRRVKEMTQDLEPADPDPGHGDEPPYVQSAEARSRPASASGRGHERRHHAATGAPRPHPAAAQASRPVAPAWTVRF